MFQAKEATKKLEQANRDAQLTREKLSESEKSAKEALRKVKTDIRETLTSALCKKLTSESGRER